MTEILLCLYKPFVSYDRTKMKKIGDFFVLTWLIVAGPVTYYELLVILYIAKIVSSVCMDYSNLKWLHPFLHKALKQAISLCTEDGVATKLHGIKCCSTCLPMFITISFHCLIALEASVVLVKVLILSCIS